jgi:hypothetical protein
MEAMDLPHRFYLSSSPALGLALVELHHLEVLAIHRQQGVVSSYQGLPLVLLLHRDPYWKAGEELLQQVQII